MTNKGLKTLLIILPVVAIFVFAAIVLYSNGYLQETHDADSINSDSSVTVTQSTTGNTKKSVYPTESECVSKIEAEYSRLMAGSGYKLTLVFDRYVDKSPVYNIQISGYQANMGFVTLSSPVSSDLEGYGYITGLVVNIDNSTMPYTSENINIVQSCAAVPLYVYAKLCNTHTKETFSEFQQEFSLKKENTNFYIYEIRNEEMLLLTNKYQAKCLTAYGELECDYLRALLNS